MIAVMVVMDSWTLDDGAEAPDDYCLDDVPGSAAQQRPFLTFDGSKWAAAAAEAQRRRAVELRAARGTLRGKCGVVEPPLGVDSSQCGVANLARANDLSRSHSCHRRHSVPQLFRLDRLEKRNRRTPRRREVLGR